MECTISEDLLKEIDNLRNKTGKYRFETKDDPNGGAPTFNVVKMDERMLRSNQDSLYSDINKSVIKIKRKGNSYFVESGKDKHKIVNISNLDCEEEQKYKPIGMTYLVEGKVNYEFCKKIGIKEWVYTKLWVNPYLYDRLFDTYLFR